MEWANEMQCGVTVCDIDANIVYMNEKAKNTFKRFGTELVGRNLKEFHGEKSWDTICKLLKENKSSHYTIVKGDIKKIIHQNPWYENGVLKGLIEFSFEIPVEMPHYNRN